MVLLFLAYSTALFFTTPVYEKVRGGELGERQRVAGGERNAEGICQSEECQQTLRFLSGQLKLLTSRRPYWSVWGTLRTGYIEPPSPTKMVQCGTKSSLSKECFCTASILFSVLLFFIIFSCVPFFFQS